MQPDGLEPVTHPAAPELEWAPPGHGDLYASLLGSGMLAALRAAGYRYAFVSNADNLGAVLDPALLRPGRFDRQIGVDAPDLQGRKKILEVHAKGKPVAPGVDLEVIARRTPGFTGADLANVINEAALLTARTGGKQITLVTLEEAIDRVMAGPQRKTRLMNDKERKVTAYHEAGHALVAHALPNTDPVHKITILPRGRALGYTMVLPLEDKYSQSRAELLDMLAYAMGGRAAEELVFHDPTTGASNDIEKATATARAMVTQYGMSERLGAVKFGQESGEVFMGRDMGHGRDYSEEVAAQVDAEVRALVENGHHEAWEILVEHRDVLDDMVLKLLDKETLDRDEVAEIFAAVPKRPSRQHPTGNGRRESYASVPMPRMTNTYMLGGTKTPEEIIGGLKRGLYATNFGGGQVDITSGKFVFSASEAFWVEDGKIQYPVKGATIIGNGPDALTRVSAIGNDMRLDTGVGVCGKEGQSVPVGVGQPTLRIDRLTVGGTA